MSQILARVPNKRVLLTVRAASQARWPGRGPYGFLSAPPREDAKTAASGRLPVMNKTWLLHVLGLVGVVVGCGARVSVDTGGAGGDGTGSAGTGSPAGSTSCDLRTFASHICTTYNYGNLDPTGQAAAAEISACNAAKGTPGSCPTANALGTCTMSTAGVTASVTYYSDSSTALNLAEAQMACTASGGTFM